jgi:hypothetical protein
VRRLIAGPDATVNAARSPPVLLLEEVDPAVLDQRQQPLVGGPLVLGGDVPAPEAQPSFPPTVRGVGGPVDFDFAERGSAKFLRLIFSFLCKSYSGTLTVRT